MQLSDINNQGVMVGVNGFRGATLTPDAVPEASSAALMTLGIAAVVARRRRIRRGQTTGFRSSLLFDAHSREPTSVRDWAPASSFLPSPRLDTTCWTIESIRATPNLPRHPPGLRHHHPARRCGDFLSLMFEVSVEQTFAADHALRNYKGAVKTFTATISRSRWSSPATSSTRPARRSTSSTSKLSCAPSSRASTIS